ncbi:MAG: hypothetical protein A2287_04675 [Candidatus Melainabacteria bacterium RIFOXYA12_FULL_32_12]|nr:MAG: hypothetical protein A2287_04675 [Candidatus Melainabacteria bacterium RIFOXYA12_FULL_32_12]
MDQFEFKKIRDKYTDFPVSVIDIANELGIKVYETDSLPSNVSGLIGKELNGEFSIYVNAKHAATRKIFTIAHEIGHYINDFDILNNGNQFITYKKADIETNFVMARADIAISSQEYRKKETAANYFAAELLMPAAKFLEVVNIYDEIQDVAAFFGVSCSAASVRASQLGKFFI